MAFDPTPRTFPVREAALAALLVLSALAVLTLVFLASAAGERAQAAEQANADALTADRALVELRLALLENPPDNARAAAAYQAAKRALAGDREGLPTLEALETWTTPTPATADGGALAAWTTLRSHLAQASTQAHQVARDEAERARDLTLLAGVLLVALTVGTMLLILAEMQRRRRLAQALEREANRDPLTMLPNRRFFLEWLGYAIANCRRDATRIGVLYVDLDGFKAVNDRHGHRRGDAVLAALAERLRATKREGDLLARLGGDEFAVAVPNARDGNELAALGERLLAALVDPKLPKLAEVPIGASIGIAFAPDDADDVPGLLAAADAAMYAAKRAGGQRVTFYAAQPA